ncbi:ubiquitin-like domain-containing CTD phosphatase 1 [Pollicipes pollicipes]|uniref:ubiquitin-like domain-containing CTD phosphatase 1 n=1 Tax=Pollicipes pollicipes TaxID=41117 RepID=UPI0018849815|nr:ubiquitin-like domain-containing CTD phosphatase 1 [Pollicipes pollicipes]XP_037092682.1 ubiquitin-like domain-containing CTD phosphatase 1 [Pollicipes pollicipes]
MSGEAAVEDEGTVQLTVKWSGQELDVRLLATDTVADLRDALCLRTRVLPARQKLLNLKLGGRPAPDSAELGALGLRPGARIMMMGSPEEAIAAANEVPEEAAGVLDDFFEEEGGEVPIHLRPEYVAKVERRVRDYKVEVKNPLREGKRLLVLDIDYTLFDHRSVADSGSQLMRPYLHEFLTSAYRDYDIVIWSATSMRWIDEKMRLLGVSAHPDYKIAFHLDNLAMITVHSEHYGVTECKPLAVIWGKFPDTSAANTIMFDDVRHNFLMNRQSGLRIRPFRQAHQNRDKDVELLLLARYLRSIARLEDFGALRHRDWERYLERHPPPED